MTEAEWLNRDDPFPRQLAIVHQVATVRKLQLIAAACIRGAQAGGKHADAKRCDDLVEEVADRVRPWEAINAELARRPGNWRLTHVIQVPQEPAAVAKALRSLLATYPSDIARSVREVAGLILEVVGNPFRPVAFAPEWRTDTAVALARQMYDSRDFGVMPILADALQEAGCEDETILNHCREPGPHVRGCWVVDLVLGKA
jgi:hypothetical protein